MPKEFRLVFFRGATNTSKCFFSFVSFLSMNFQSTVMRMNGALSAGN